MSREYRHSYTSDELMARCDCEVANAGRGDACRFSSGRLVFPKSQLACSPKNLIQMGRGDVGCVSVPFIGMAPGGA